MSLQRKQGRVSKPKKRKSPNSAPTTKAIDILWSLVVRGRVYNACQMFGCGGRVCSSTCDAHHIFGRFMAVRWSLENGMCLCKSHHLYYVHGGNTQAAAQEDIKDIIGSQLYEKLRRQSHTTFKPTAEDRRRIHAELKAELDRLEAAA